MAQVQRLNNEFTRLKSQKTTESTNQQEITQLQHNQRFFESQIHLYKQVLFNYFILLLMLIKRKLKN